MEARRRYLSNESWAIILICVADLLITLVLIDKGLAEEGNPLMRFYLGHGVWAFVLAKSIMVAAPVVIIEWGLRHRPRTVATLARAGIAGYLGIYALMFLTINVPAMRTAQEPDWAEFPPIDRELLRLEREGYLPGPEMPEDVRAPKAPHAPSR
ncbi:MAG: DUF5658 family protein [Fimbriimonadales bacterium]|nr:DUF5658 family protein [Armatimonadota bacterium]MCX7687559.1 DUF5658 family protein [Fimbriimonadales bacterium]CUU11261.1 hypothetical protein GBSOP10_110927 [Armatimonadetes bacterium GBS]CUU34066.1 hypothetical protein DCOP10_10463 [Armatimonadetes bacterium DC]CUU34512.1 hypothetical protein GXSOP10_11677 [Armatimonadetes bacterium GXS]GBC91395.1 hypothetical protein HRbin14_02163 [bacterium HR14]